MPNGNRQSEINEDSSMCNSFQSRGHCYDKKSERAGNSDSTQLGTATIPPYWADLVRASSKLHVYTERHIDTWQSLPEIIPENGDFTSEQTEVPMDSYE